MSSFGLTLDLDVRGSVLGILVLDTIGSRFVFDSRRRGWRKREIDVRLVLWNDLEFLQRTLGTVSSCKGAWWLIVDSPRER